MQLVYEASAHCTSIIATEKETETPLHIRTMEWEMPFLRPITI
jgi:penicillin V acylase-like amidase (Ntn superfamily)